MLLLALLEDDAIKYQAGNSQAATYVVAILYSEPIIISRDTSFFNPTQNDSSPVCEESCSSLETCCESRFN